MLLSAPVPERSLKFNLIVWNDLDLYPYRQSATDWKKPQGGRPRTSTELHSDSIEIEGSEEVSKVKFIPFLGISPIRYRDFFEKGRRKDKRTGKIIRWAGGVGVPIVEIYHPVYIDLETIVSSKLQEDKRLSEQPPVPA